MPHSRRPGLAWIGGVEWKPGYSMTSSGRARIAGEIVNPSALAALRLTTSSNLSAVAPADRLAWRLLQFDRRNPRQDGPCQRDWRRRTSARPRQPIAETRTSTATGDRARLCGNI